MMSIPIIDFGFSNLLVSGCSFTYTKNINCPSWPCHLRDLGSFDHLHDLSFPGAGNTHIHHSVIWELENNTALTPENTFVAVMWSGYDRDDIIVDPLAIDPTYSGKYQYTDQAWLALTGGVGSRSNTIVSIDAIKKIKNLTSRSVDNYILISSLHHYLTARKFKFVFLEFCTPLSKYDLNFEPTVYLGSLAESFRHLVRQVQPNLGDYADVQSISDRHPQPEHHSEWCQSVLIPYIKQSLATDPNSV